jgi:hypothetical protein
MPRAINESMHRTNVDNHFIDDPISLLFSYSICYCTLKRDDIGLVSRVQQSNCTKTVAFL